MKWGQRIVMRGQIAVRQQNLHSCVIGQLEEVAQLCGTVIYTSVYISKLQACHFEGGKNTFFIFLEK